MPRSQAWVIKLGGSLATSPALPDWLALLAETPVPCLVVPGGGPFADAVRHFQSRWSVADPAAHALAIHAMGLFGRSLAALAPRLRVADTLTEAAAAVDTGCGAVLWCPSAPDLAAMDGLPEDWSVTSDSLALWIAGRFGIPRLGLVKSCAAGPRTLVALARDAAIDDCFPRLACSLSVQITWFESDEWLEASRTIQGLTPMRLIR